MNIIIIVVIIIIIIIREGRVHPGPRWNDYDVYKKKKKKKNINSRNIDDGGDHDKVNYNNSVACASRSTRASKYLHWQGRRVGWV